ncbi:MAG: FadR family transcriptional regulator [Gammaproteobacteria bacterium]|jgi:DNA-binding FadR family transcriptional regulator|nr:FadR family transcriptional regulator [Gammaproteobacteria bacterium]
MSTSHRLQNAELNEVSNDSAAKTSASVTHGSDSAGITAQLRREILDGGYGYRERLPAERALALQFGASRGTVREALRRLEEMHLVSRRVGSGTFVRYRGHADHEDIAELTSPLELIDVRLVVEPHMARLAVMHANAQDLQRMLEALTIVEGVDDNVEDFSRADEAFHLALAESSRNPLLLWLYRHINEVRRHTQWDARKDKILTATRIAEYNQQHRELYAAIASRDIEHAVRAISGHLEKARSDLMGIE